MTSTTETTPLSSIETEFKNIFESLSTFTKQTRTLQDQFQSNLTLNRIK